ncbi:MAG TPA: hypothetical protein VJ548_08090 [Azospira sp.]|nr:hypothetical protein [Azospira sp.]
MRAHLLPLPLLCSLGLLACLSACVPAPLGKYYKPIYEAPGATYSGDQCRGQAGAPASLTWEVADGVTLNVSAWRSYGERDRPDRPLRLTFQLPLDTRFQFLADGIRVSKRAEDEGQVIPAKLDIAATIMMPSGQAVDMTNIAPTPFNDPAARQAVENFSGSVSLHFSWQDNFVPQALAMEIPPIVLLDTPSTALAPLKVLATAKKRPDRYPGEFKSQTSLIYTTPASEAALAARYAKCTQETPPRKCEQIPLYDDGGFSLAQRGFNFSGRWYVYDVEKHTPFSGSLNVAYSEPVKWKFASNNIRITDLSSQAERTYQFERFPLYLRYQVPFATPVRGVNDAPYSKTTSININSSLGREELPRYFIKLPPVLINGKQYQIKPIELERRLFDFGLEPFNC